MHATQQLPLQKIVPEQTVVLEPLHGNSARKGRFDFLVLSQNGASIGIEVLLRPSHGKMKEKLSYAKEVDEFVFVMPSNSFELYRKNPRNGFRLQARPVSFSPEFGASSLKAWLVNPKNGQIEQKNRFSELFNVKPVLAANGFFQAKKTRY